MLALALLSTLLGLCDIAWGAINRQAIVTRYNPTRDASSPTTPMQVGNGNFAFGADVTGLQTFKPFAIMTSWAWKNDSLPPGRTAEDLAKYRGTQWLNHGRLVQYDFGGERDLEQWLISNPNRVNLARFGLVFWSEDGSTALNVTENELTDVHQELDLWVGVITSKFSFEGVPITVTTSSADSSDTVGITISSELVAKKRLSVFVDFPWNDGKAKFSAPFVGKFNAAANHTTTLDSSGGRSGIRASILHRLETSTFITSFGGQSFDIDRDSPDAHRYTLRPTNNSTNFSFSAAFSTRPIDTILSPSSVVQSSRRAWRKYWLESAFVDVVTGSTDPRADELQRRIILSRYLMKVNEAGDTPPQESGLVNNGWYGKFHMEMYFWHAAHWALWGNWDILNRSTSIYSRFLPSSIARAQTQQGWSSGARWPKMTDPSGRTAPGQINNVLIWQQPHPLVFAQYEYRAFPTQQTLQKWGTVVRETANWMASFAWYNTTTDVYDLGPPVHVVSEDTRPNATLNPAFELAYWRLGLEYAERWMQKLGQPVPRNWTDVKDNLAPLPTSNGTYDVYEGIENTFWSDPEYTNDHPALVGLHGWLPPTPELDVVMARRTAEKVWTAWNTSNCWGWDFPMLAMSAARIGHPDKAIDWLLDPLFVFDDVGMPVGGIRVPTPYFPGSGGLLYAIGMMAGGWDGIGRRVPGFPKSGWNIAVEGMGRAL